MSTGVAERFRERVTRLLPPAQGPEFLAWERTLFDYDRWRLLAVVRRGRRWLGATRRRRRAVWLLTAVLALVFLPMAPGATAQTDTAVIDTPAASTLGSGQITDSSGVPLSNYVFATNHGSLFNPQDFGMSSVDEINFGLWEKELEWSEEVNHAAVTGGVPQAIGSVLTKVTDRFSSQLAISSILIVCATIGALFVAYFVVRGFHAKAAMQVVTMILVAIIGPLYLAHPLSDALSSNGLLAQGQNLGISLAAGFNGTPTTEPDAMQASMEHDMVDQFGRYPLQVWNFGHVVDNSATCKTAWTRGAMTSNEDEIKSGMKSCGDSVAYSLAANPTASQMGQGFILVVVGLFELLFQFYLFWVIVWAFFRAVWSAGCAIVGFAGSGFVYGPPQIFLIRSVVEGFVAAGAMVGYIALDGGYELFVGDLFDVAQGQTMVVMILCVFMPILAFTQLRRMRKGMESANDFIANRLGQAAQGGSGGGGGGGRALGMGNAAAGNSLSGFKMMAGLAAANALSSNFAFEWLAGATPNFLHPFARGDKLAKKANSDAFKHHRFLRGRNNANVQGLMHREKNQRLALDGAVAFGGINSHLGAGAAISNVVRAGGSLDDAYAAMIASGFSAPIAWEAVRSWGGAEEEAAGYPLSDANLRLLLGAASRASISARRYAMRDPHQSAEEVAADFATFEAAAHRYRRHHRGGVTLSPENLDIAQRYFEYPDKLHIGALRELSGLSPYQSGADLSDDFASLRHELRDMDPEHAHRVLDWITNEAAKRTFDSSLRLMRNPGDYETMRQAREAAYLTQQIHGFKTGSVIDIVNPPDSDTVHLAPHDWNSRLSPLSRRLRTPRGYQEWPLNGSVP
ncbi:hypothetical protein [Nocardia alni]|uniref:hypothetical protein n=1 Tax=Nocardia alni TaxID=2815723 RepID=UPI001C20FB6D|nr:hypothetical protein [Nocardia alni]